MKEYTTRWKNREDSRNTLREFGGFDIGECSALSALLSGIPKDINYYYDDLPNVDSVVLTKDENNVITLKAIDAGNNKTSQFAKFEGSHIVEILIPKQMYVSTWAFKEFFTSHDCEYLRKASFPKHYRFDHDVLQYAFDLKTLDIPKLECAGNNFLKFSQIKTLNAPDLWFIGDYFLYHNEELVNLNTPKLEIVGKNGLYNNDKIQKLNLPLLSKVGDNFLYANSRLDDRLTKLPRLEKAGRDCQPLINEWVIYNKMKHR